jgi:hypothetical protein
VQERYTISSAGERVIYAQRVDGAVRLSDKPATNSGRGYFIESGLHSHTELQAIPIDYLDQAARRDAIPARVLPLT